MKKILTLLFVVFLLFSAEQSKAATAYFTDIDGHWAQDYIDMLRKAEIMNGTDNKAMTEANITRGEFAAMTIRAFFEQDNHTNIYFDDVGQDHIFAKYISTAFEKGIIKGIDNRHFGPEEPITREQIALIIARLGILEKTDGSKKFSDIGKDYIYLDELNICTGNGILTGYENNTFRPYNNATRAEASVMIAKTMENCISEANKSDIKIFADKILNSDMEGTGFFEENSIGNALDSIKYTDKLSIYKDKVKARYDDFKLDSLTMRGRISEAVYSGDVNYSSDTYDVGYKVIKKYSILHTPRGLMVYDSDTDLQVEQKINLTWEVSSKAPAYSPEGLTHISPTSYQISTTKQAGKVVDIGSNKLKLYDNMNSDHINYAKKNNYGLWAMYKTDFTTETANAILRDENARMRVIDYLMNQCLSNGITGINFDFENMYMTDKEAFSHHVRETALAMHTIGVAVSVDVTKYESTSKQWSLCYDRDELSKSADYIMLMAYDQYYAGSKTAGPVAGLGWTRDALELTLREVPAKKLVLGIPFYTRYWQSVNGQVVSTKALSMESAIEMIKQNNPKLIYVSKDDQHKALWQTGEIEHSFWFENAETAGKRAKLVNEYNLAGIASWRRGFETADVWEIIDAEING